MLTLLAAAFSLQVQGAAAHKPRPDSLVMDSARVLADSSHVPADTVHSSERRYRDRKPRRTPVTPALLASAFQDPAARTLLTRARAARLEQDSSLVAYDATARQRMSAGLGFRRIGRHRLVFRHENVARVRWQQGVGAWVELKGARTVIPVAPGTRVLAEIGESSSPIPYFPGREALWAGSGVAKAEVDESELVHPLARGAEAYYRYATGDSISFRLPDGRTIRLTELKVEARRPQWNLIVGSFWFDAASAQLVRAAYRLAVPMDIVAIAEAEEGEEDDDDIPRWLRPMTATVKAITIEYGLHEGRWWLPRAQAAEGEAQVSFMRVPFKLEESFRYASVNGRDSLPPIRLAQTDSAGGADDSAGAGDSAAVRDSTQRARGRWQRESTYDDGDALVHVSHRYDSTLIVAVRVPKDTMRLAYSPDLPPSIYEPGEELFGTREAEELMAELDFGLQPAWAPQRPTFHWGLERGLMRYNRVEGLSAGVAVTQTFGRGYSGEATVRLGLADWEPNGELTLRRGDGRRTIGLGVYRRLAVANDWGSPLGLGASLSALVFARDEGFYYRTWGVELTGERDRGSLFTWRLFAEEQSDADVETQFSVAHVINDVRFIDNIPASTGKVAGVAAAFHASRGLDPHGWRLLTHVRAEAAAGDFDYVRGAADVTVSRGLGRYLDGAVTMSAGTSGGAVPPQRLWFLGGAHTIRGQRAGVVAGDAYWFGRIELGSSFVAARPVVFGDIGWAGSRSEWSHPGRPVSGAGVGASFMDGLIRFDVAKGIRPSRGWRTDLYLEARF